MVDGINTVDNKKTTYSEVSKRPVVSYVQVPTSSTQIRPIQQDKVIISKNQNKKAKHAPMNALQIASLGLGAVASTVLIVVLGKGLIPNKSQKVLKEVIENFNGPAEVKIRLMNEFNKLKFSFGEADTIQNYIENVMSLNWSKPEKKVVDINKAKEILNKDLVGLDGVKDQILTHLDVQNYKIKNGIADGEPLVLCLDGPPGVGKTSIASVIAKAMGKQFERISLAGVSDEPFIKGLKRYFKGAEPGEIIKAMQNAKTSDPVILLDEIDKMGRSLEHGDPASALLDILESKQCKNFKDKYLDLPYDLSNVTFIITSNDMERIPEVLRNRVKMINIAEYSNDTKSAICDLNVGRKLEELKMDKSKIKIEPSAIKEIVANANDSGARKSLEKLNTVFDKIMSFINQNGSDKSIIVDDKFVRTALNIEPSKASVSV